MFFILACAAALLRSLNAAFLLALSLIFAMSALVQSVSHVEKRRNSAAVPYLLVLLETTCPTL